MSDFEGRVTEALHGGAAEAPDALGLAEAARGRARARRRSRTAAIGAGAAAALVVPVAVVALSGGDSPDGDPVAADPTLDAPVDRWESWRGVTVQVPDAWQYGDQYAWCADGGAVGTFRISRPGGVTPSIACTPNASYGLLFQDVEMDATDEPFDWPVVTQTGGGWPAGTYVGAHGESGVLVTVAGPDARQVLDVLATVQSYGRSDPNGCGPRVEDDLYAVVDGGMAVCRYDATGALEQSELLTGSNAADAAEALDSTVDGDLDCAPADGPGATIEMFDGERDVSITLDGACTVLEGRPGGIADPDVLWWALSPGFSGDTTGLPMGSVLRSYDPAGQ